MTRTLLLVALASLLGGCATPRLPMDPSGPVATVTYIRQDVNHYIDEATGQVIPAETHTAFAGKLISTEYRKTFASTIYQYRSTECQGGPTIIGHINLDQPTTVKVSAGQPLVNSYRTQFQSCEKNCFKRYYTASVFTPEENGRYELVVEPIDGPVLYKLENGERIPQPLRTDLPERCQY
ncbi:hypothetical protein FCL40_14800 [Ferrimonas sediminicola]|uniref:Uncharacterized protein n=1 Tax=Ferrimonas sediminicola TaxID=2569538 RepID=A0A4U1BA99_9GAMM|nr:hypothetical protein [Ferrimonas sediminicola]TKB47743.1 hypothetical protein FCL40_14800 [Ferrimonas sediminicola]